MICNKCKNEIHELKIDMFNYDGSDSEVLVPITEYETGAIGFETNRNWCGYELSEEEQKERIRCPVCGEAIECEEIQIYDIADVVVFQSKGE